MIKKSNFQFKDPKIIKSHFDIKLDIFDKESIFQNKYGLLTETNVKKSNNTNEAMVILTVQTKNNEEAPILMEVQVASIFEWDDKMNNVVDDFLKVNAASLLYGYLKKCL